MSTSHPQYLQIKSQQIFSHTWTALSLNNCSHNTEKINKAPNLGAQLKNILKFNQQSELQFLATLFFSK